MKLTGDELLEYLNENKGANRDDIIEGAGYFEQRGGKKRLQRQNFYGALAKAYGHEEVATVEGPGRGSSGSYRLKVSPMGLIPVSKAYTGQCNMEPGTYVRVVIEDGAIILEPDVAKPAVKAPPAATLATVA